MMTTASTTTSVHRLMTPILVVLLILLNGITFVKAQSPVTTTTTSQQPLYNKTVCILPLLTRIERGAHAYHTVQYYQDRFPLIRFNPVYIMPNEPNIKGFVTTWVTRGRDECDLVIGAGFSFLAIAMSPLVDIPWVGTTETSTELSDKENHPTFSRVIPTDEVGSQAADIIYQQYGWNSTNIFCSDESYGRSVAAGMSSAIQQRGGSVEVSRCLEASATGDRVEGVLDALLASKTRIVFVAMLPSSTLFASFKEILLRRGATDQLVFVYSEAFCLAATPVYLELAGGLCATYLADPQVIDPFFTSYQARDISAELDALEALGFPRNEMNINSTTSVSGAFAHDATLHAMNSVYQHNITGSSANIFTFIRTQETAGATGTISLTDSGDRASVDVVVYNVDATQGHNVIANIKSGVFSYVSDPRPDLYLLGNTIGPQDPYPAGTIADPVSTEDTTTAMTLGIAFGCLFILLIAAAVPLMRYLNKRGTRDVANAPADSDQPFAIIFTDIQSSTTLWARLPELMSAAVEEHHSLIRGLLNEYNGYEVKTIGDSFMCAFKSIDMAVEFGLKLQEVFLAHDWDDDGQIEGLYQEMFAEKIEEMEAEALAEGKKGNLNLPETYSGQGIRVRIGLHYGKGNIQMDQVTNAYDYYGTVVNTAARVEGVGHGGQFVITKPALDAIKGRVKDEFDSLDLGPAVLRGLDEPIGLYQLNYTSNPDIAERKFPPLRLEHANDDVGDEMEEIDGTESHDGKSVRSAHSGKSMANMGAFLEHLALKSAKRSGARGRPEDVADRLLDYHTVIKVLFSTSDAKYREKLAKHLCSKWGVQVGGGLGDTNLSKDNVYLVTLLDITSRVMAVADSHIKKRKLLKNGDSSFRSYDPLGGSAMMIASVNSNSGSSNEAPAFQQINNNNNQKGPNRRDSRLLPLELRAVSDQEMALVGADTSSGGKNSARKTVTVVDIDGGNDKKTNVTPPHQVPLAEECVTVETPDIEDEATLSTSLSTNMVQNTPKGSTPYN